MSITANLVLAPIDGTATTPPISFGGSFEGNSGTGLYGSFGQMYHAINGADVVLINSSGLAMQNSKTISGNISGNIAGATTLGMTNDVIILTNAGIPSNGGAGTGAGSAGPGSMCVDYTNANLYINANTKASPTWKLVTRAA